MHRSLSALLVMSSAFVLLCPAYAQLAKPRMPFPMPAGIPAATEAAKMPRVDEPAPASLAEESYPEDELEALAAPSLEEKVGETCQAPTVARPDEELAGIDTVDSPDPQGNWLFKRMWWERAEERYDQVRAAAQKVEESRVNFMTVRADVDRNILDPFYLQVGFSRGQLSERIGELIAILEAGDEKGEGLRASELYNYARLKEEERQLRKLAQDIERVTGIDHEIDDALAKFTEAGNRVRQHERRAWDQFRQIAHTLSDEKARELFFKIDEAWRNITNIGRYVDDQLAPHFGRVINEVRTTTANILATVDELKKRGISLQIEIMQQPPTTADDEDEEKAVPADTGVIQTYLISPLQNIIGLLLSPLRIAWDSAMWLITAPYRLIFGESSAPQDEDEEDED